jgi:hypothetical protein
VHSAASDLHLGIFRIVARGDACGHAENATLGMPGRRAGRA